MAADGPQIIYGQPHKVYHEDPAPDPSFTASVGDLLLDRSPRHAWRSHPRLNPNWKPRDPSDEMDEGSAMHTLVLGEGAEILTVPNDSWRTDGAKFLRSKARQAHQIPILKRREPDLIDAAKAIRADLRRHPGCGDLFQPGRAEVTCMWPARGSWHRLRVDWLPEQKGAPIFDLKFTSRSAAADDWERQVWEQNALRIAYYNHGIEAVRGTAPLEYRLVVCEIEEPYGINVFAAANDVLAVGAERCELALRLWDVCRKVRGRWPSYPKKILHVEMPTWRLRELEEVGMGRTRQIETKGRKHVELIAHLQQIANEMGHPLS